MYYWAGSVYACQATFFAWANDVLRYEEDSLRAVVIASMNMGSNAISELTGQRLVNQTANIFCRCMVVYRVLRSKLRSLFHTRNVGDDRCVHSHGNLDSIACMDAYPHRKEARD